MQQHVYEASNSEIFRHSFWIWLAVLFQVVVNAGLDRMFLVSGRFGDIILINAMLCCITIPSVRIFISYYRHSVGKRFIITYNSLKLVDNKTGSEIEMQTADIKRIELYCSKRSPGYLSPAWMFHEYFCLIDGEGRRIVIPSYIMEIAEFWQDTLTRRVSSDKLIIYNKVYPIIN